MKKVIAILSVILLILVGCAGKEDNLTKKTEKKLPDVKKEEVIKKLTADLAKFHFVADWLTNTEIVYVEKEAGNYFVKSFNIQTGEIKILYEEPSIIIDVFIHPSKEHLLIHTTDNPASGTVKIISLDGIVQHEVSIESSELEIEWNDIDPSLILMTAFYEDWTYDVFVYEGSESNVRLLTLENPFPKWFGTEKIVLTDISGHALDGGELYIYDRISAQQESPDINGVIHYDTYQESLLLMRITEDEKVMYTILNQDQSILSEWQMPAVSNYSEWVIPEIHWISKGHIILASTESEGQQDELKEPYQLVQVVEGEQVLIAKEVLAGPLTCSPDGEKCLMGYTFENLIDIKSKEETVWLRLDE